MKKIISLIALTALLNLASGCEKTYDNNQKLFGDRNEIRNGKDITYFGNIQVETDIKEIKMAKLTDYPDVSTTISNKDNSNFSGVFNYWLLSFQTPEGTKSFISSQPFNFIKGKNYQVGYLEFVKEQEISEYEFFNGFVKGESPYYISTSRNLPNNLEGVITLMYEIAGDTR